MKKVIGVLKKNIFIILYIILFIIMCLVIKYNFLEAFEKLDNSIKYAVDYNLRTPFITEMMKVITHAGSTVAVISVFLLSILMFKNKIVRIILFLNLITIEIIKEITKLLIARPRPVFSIIKMPSDYSFPSGHTFFAVGFYGLIIYFILKSKLDAFNKVIFTIIFSVLILLIPFSRLYLGVHYFTDIIGGFVLGIFVLLFYITTYLGMKED